MNTKGNDKLRHSQCDLLDCLDSTVHKLPNNEVFDMLVSQLNIKIDKNLYDKIAQSLSDTNSSQVKLSKHNISEYANNTVRSNGLTRSKPKWFAGWKIGVQTISKIVQANKRCDSEQVVNQLKVCFRGRS